MNCAEVAGKKDAMIMEGAVGDAGGEAAGAARCCVEGGVWLWR